MIGNPCFRKHRSVKTVPLTLGTQAMATSTTGAKVHIGDVFEFRTPCGLSYLQYTTTDPLFGDLIRVLPNVFNSRPPSVHALVQEKERYFVFFPIMAAKQKTIVQFISNFPIPPWAEGMPVMRRPGGIARDGKVMNWFIRSDQGEIRVDKLSKEQQLFSIAEVWNDAMLAQRICEDWQPEMTV